MAEVANTVVGKIEVELDYSMLNHGGVVDVVSLWRSGCVYWLYAVTDALLTKDMHDRGRMKGKVLLGIKTETNRSVYFGT